MKNLKNISIFTLAAYSLLLLSSCTDTTDEFVVSETEPVTLSELTITDIELDPVNTNNPAITFNWTQADYGQQASVNYSLEISADQSFTNAVIPATVNGNNTITLSVSELNSVLVPEPTAGIALFAGCLALGLLRILRERRAAAGY